VRARQPTRTRPADVEAAPLVADSSRRAAVAWRTQRRLPRAPSKASTSRLACTCSGAVSIRSPVGAQCATGDRAARWRAAARGRVVELAVDEADRIVGGVDARRRDDDLDAEARSRSTARRVRVRSRAIRAACSCEACEAGDAVARRVAPAPERRATRLHACSGASGDVGYVAGLVARAPALRCESAGSGRRRDARPTTLGAAPTLRTGAGVQLVKAQQVRAAGKQCRPHDDGEEPDRRQHWLTIPEHAEHLAEQSWYSQYSLVPVGYSVWQASTLPVFARQVIRLQQSSLPMHASR
jgi:hypothetical protein